MRTSLRLLFFIAALLHGLSAAAQNAFFDALTVRPLVDTSADFIVPTLPSDLAGASIYLSAMARYVPLPAAHAPRHRLGKLATDSILRAFKNNPFLLGDSAKIRADLNQFQNIWSDNPRTEVSVQPSPAIATSTGGFSVTNLADGLAKFLVKRTKEELTVAFFRQFQLEIQQNKEITLLFPVTADLLGLIGKDIYKFNVYLASLRDGFLRDMKSLPTNLSRYLKQSDLIQKPGLRLAMEDVLDFSQFLLDGQSPDSLLWYFAQEAAMQDVARREALKAQDELAYRRVTDLAAGFRLLNRISESLRDTAEGRIWLRKEQIAATFKDSTTLNLYLGFLWQSCDSIRFSNGRSARDVLGQFAHAKDRVRAFRVYLSNFAAQTKEVEVNLQALRRSTKTDTVAYDGYYRFFSSFFSFLETGARFELDFVQLPDADATVSNFIKKVKLLNELNFDVRQRHYTIAVTNTVGFLDEILASKEYKFRKPLLKYGQFIAAVAESTTSDQIAGAIESVALPVGSSSLKKDAHVSLTLNAYTGLSGGGEVLLAPSVRGQSKVFGSVFAPVGFALNWGQEERGSWSVFVPLVDVGAIAAFRFGDAQSDILPVLKWDNIVAPGFYVVRGARNYKPIAFGAGAQLGPNLRKINATSAAISNAWRYGVFITVDIPVFSLYAR